MGRSRPHERDPCFRGTRVPIQTLIDYIQGNAALEQFLDGFPSVTREQAIQFIELAKESCIAFSIDTPDSAE